MLLPLRIDLYIARIFLGFFVAGLTVFVTIFVVIDFMTNLVRDGASLQSLLAYYGYLIPSVIYQMTPVACLLATISTLSSLSRNQEMVALFSFGMSLTRIAAPVLVLVTLISGFVFFMNDKIVPAMNQKKNYIYFVDIKKQPGLYSTVKTNKIWYRSGNVIFNIKTLQADQGKAQGLTMYYVNFGGVWQLAQMLTAEDVEFKGTNWLLKVARRSRSHLRLKPFECQKMSVIYKKAVEAPNLSGSESCRSLSKKTKKPA
jgi:lipopolysaccharide export system permease protein